MNHSFGSLYADILWAHDERDFVMLEKKAEQMYTLRGFQENTAKRAAKLLTNCYLLADKAEKNNDYSQVHRGLLSLGLSLGYGAKIPGFQHKWWMAFREGNKLTTLYYIFQQNRQSLDFVQTCLSTYYLARVGLAHNKRNKLAAARFADSYWKIASRISKEKQPLLG